MNDLYIFFIVSIILGENPYFFEQRNISSFDGGECLDKVHGDHKGFNTMFILELECGFEGKDGVGIAFFLGTAVLGF